MAALLLWTLRLPWAHDTAAALPASAAALQPVGLSAAQRLQGGTTTPVPAAATLAASVPALAVAVAVAPRLDAAERPAGPAAGPPVWDLCGLGRLPVPTGATAKLDPEQALNALPAHLGRDAMVQAYLALFAVLDAGPPRWRAAAVMLRGSDAAGLPQAQALPALARMADDAVTAMWAQQRCDLGAACIDAAERWARVEPQNLAPWVHLLARQPQRRDELMARMATATRFDSHEHALSMVVLEATPGGVAPYLQPALWIDVIGVEAAMSLPSFKAVSGYCHESLAPGSEVLRVCSAIARTLAERSDSAVGVGMGLRLAERTGLSRAEAARRRAVLNALQRAPDEIFDRQQPLSCVGVARTRAWVEQRARLGELGALQARAAQRAASTAVAPR